MDLMMWAMIGGGLLLLLVGGELVVRGGVAAALRLGVSTSVVGVVLLGFGTSAPELVTSLESALKGSPGIAVGNVVGSNIANLLLIAGLAAALSGAAVSQSLLRRDGLSMLGFTLALTVLLYLGGVGRLAGAALLAALAIYLIWAVRSSRGETADEVEEAAQSTLGVGGALGLFAVGLGAILLGAHFLVDGAVVLARTLGASEAMIGVTIVAIGTSLPELATTIAAAARGRTEMAIGNVFGSNIFNCAAIIGTTAVVSPLPTAPELAQFDIWAMVAATLLVLVFAWTRAHLSRGEGAILLGLYVAFIAMTVSNGL